MRSIGGAGKKTGEPEPGKGPQRQGNAVGVDERQRKLARYVTWNAEDLAEFSEALAAQRPVDDLTGLAALRGD
jgi:hypothetical protein